MFLMPIWATLNVCLHSVNKFYTIFLITIFFNRVSGSKIAEKRNTLYQTKIYKLCHVRLTQ